MNDIEFFSGFLFIILFISYAAFSIEKLRRSLEKKVGFLELWWLVGSLEIRKDIDFGASDKDKIISTKTTIKRGVYFLTFFMVAFVVVFSN